MQFILGERSSVGQRLADVLDVEVWKLLYDLCGRHAIGDEVHNVRHGNTKSPDRGASGEGAGLVGDAIVVAWHEVLESNSSSPFARRRRETVGPPGRT